MCESHAFVFFVLRGMYRHVYRNRSYLTSRAVRANPVGKIGLPPLLQFGRLELGELNFRPIFPP